MRFNLFWRGSAREFLVYVVQKGWKNGAPIVGFDDEPIGIGSSACRSLEITDQPTQSAEKMLQKINGRHVHGGAFTRPLGQVMVHGVERAVLGEHGSGIRLGLHYPAWTVMQTLDSSFIPGSSALEIHSVPTSGKGNYSYVGGSKRKKSFKLLPNYSG